VIAGLAFWLVVAVLVTLCLWWGCRLLVALATVLLERRDPDGW
jgi:hypothetical protein